MSEDRTVHTDALKTLGKIIDSTQKRDAIHIAVEPVIAGGYLRPGQHVGFYPNGTVGDVTNRIGVVDPFLKHDVRQGDRFWLLVYPRTITSLRHVWEHPEFPSALAENSAMPPKQMSVSEKWMRAWARKHFMEDLEYDIGTPSEDAAYAFALEIGDTHRIGSFENARDYIDSEWWGHWEALTGRKGDRDQYFSCAC